MFPTHKSHHPKLITSEGGGERCLLLVALGDGDAVKLSGRVGILSPYGHVRDPYQSSPLTAPIASSVENMRDLPRRLRFALQSPMGCLSLTVTRFSDLQSKHGLKEKIV